MDKFDIDMEMGIVDKIIAKQWDTVATSWLKSMITPSTLKKHSKQEDKLLEYGKILIDELGKNYLNILKNKAKMEKELDKQIEQAITKSLKKFE